MSSLSDFCHLLFSSALSGGLGHGNGNDMRVTSIQDCAMAAEDMFQKMFVYPRQYTLPNDMSVSDVKARLLQEKKSHIATKLDAYKDPEKQYIDLASSPMQFLPLDTLEANRVTMLAKKNNLSGKCAYKSAVAKFEDKIADIADCMKFIKIQKSFDYDVERLARDLRFISDEFPFDSYVFYSHAKKFISSDQGVQNAVVAAQLSLCCDQIEYFFNIRGDMDISILDRWRQICPDSVDLCMAEVEGIIDKKSISSFKQLGGNPSRGGAEGNAILNSDLQRLLLLKDQLQLKDDDLLISQFFDNKITNQKVLDDKSPTASSSSFMPPSNSFMSDSVIVCDIQRGLPSRLSTQDAAILSASIQLALGTARLMAGQHYNQEVIDVFQDAIQKLERKTSGI